MKFAALFKPAFVYTPKTDELIFDFNNINLLKDISKNTKEEQTINIYLNEHPLLETEGFEKAYLDKLLEVKRIRKNLVISINEYYFRDYIKDIQELKKNHGIEFISVIYPKTFSEVEELVELGVKEVYITGDLGFYIPRLYKMIGGRAGIRVIPDVNQVDANIKDLDISVLSSFWIRPDDLPIYEPYVDTLEFYHTQPQQLQAIFEIYKKQKWMGSIDLLIQGLNTYDYNNKGSIGNNHIAPYFGENRLDCGRRCLYGDCKLCSHIESLARAFKNAGMSINRPAKKSNLNELEEEDIKKFIKILEDVGQNKDNDPEEKTDNVS